MKFNIVDNLYAQPVPAGQQNVVKQTTQSVKEGTVTTKTRKKGIFSDMSMIVPLLLIVVFYFFLIRPQQKREKQKKLMLSQIKKNDKVVTRGGIWGVVASVDNEKGIAIIKIAKNINIEVTISAIEIVNPQTKPDKDSSKK